MQEKEITLRDIETMVYVIRGERVLLDFDLATLYEVPTKRLNEQVQRNKERFPSDFAFILSDQEFRGLRSQIATSNEGRGGRRSNPRAFTEEGVAMLSTVLRSKRAISVNIAIMRIFVRLRRVPLLDHELENRIAALEDRFEGKFKIIFDAIRELNSKRNIPHKRIIGLGDTDDSQ